MKSVPLAAVLCALLWMGAAPAHAEQASASDTTVETVDRSSTIRVIQQRAFLRSVRLELQLQGGLGVADSMFRHLIAVAQPRLHVTEHWAIGATYAHYFGEGTSLLDELTNGFELFPERSITKFYAGADVAWIPIEGKFALFDDAIVHFDMYLTLGGGVTQTTRGSELKPTGTIGGGLRLILTRWLGLNIEVRDHIYVESFNRGDELVNNVTLMAGLSLFIPFDYDYRFAR